MTKRQGKSGTIDVKALLSEDDEFLRALVRTALQEVLEAEMTEALGAEKGERAAGRRGYSCGSFTPLGSRVMRKGRVFVSASVGNGNASFAGPHVAVGNLRVSQTECPPGYATRITNIAKPPLCLSGGFRRCGGLAFAGVR